MGKKRITYDDPARRLAGFTGEEIESKKWIILEALSRSYDREMACKVAEISLRELALMESTDRDFKKKLKAVLDGDDASLADQARAVIRKMLGAENDSVKLRAATYLDTTRGGYGTKQKVEVSDSRDVADPVDISQFDRKPSHLRRA